MSIQNLSNFRGQNLKFRLSKETKSSVIRNLFLINLFLLIPLFSGCATVVSSPEGTITTYVGNKRVQVYAPRSARAQKVVFDTADKQMIHESDTPFRRFFNSHSADFRPGMVNYAKSTILNDLVNRIRNMEYVRGMVSEVIERHKKTAIQPTNPSKAEDKEKNNRNAKLLEDALYSALVDEGYPDIRDPRIHKVLNKFFGKKEEDIQDTDKQYRKIWQSTTGGATSKSTNPKPAQQPAQPSIQSSVYSSSRKPIYVQRSVGNKSGQTSSTNKTNEVESFKLDLMQTLREKRFFRKVIDDSVAKRLVLFNFPGSPAGGVENALEIIKKFLERFDSGNYLNRFSKTKDSLWKAYLLENKTSFKSKTSASISDSDLLAQGNNIRADFKTELQKTPDIKQAFSKVLALPKYHDYLSPGATSPARRTGVETEWPKKIAGYQSVIDQHTILETNTKELKKLLDERNPAEGARDTEKKKYVDLLRNSVEVFDQITHKSQKIQEALIKFEDSKKFIAFDSQVIDIDSNNIVEVANTVNGIVTTDRATTNDWQSTHWDEIHKAQTAYDIALSHLAQDKQINAELDKANSRLITLHNNRNHTTDPLADTVFIEGVSVKFKSPSQNLKIKAESLAGKLRDFVAAVKDLEKTKQYDISKISAALSRINDVDNFIKNATVANDLLSNAVSYLTATAKPAANSISKAFKSFKEKQDIFTGKNTAFAAKKASFGNIITPFNNAVKGAITHYNKGLTTVNQLNSDELNILLGNVDSTLKVKFASFGDGETETTGKLEDILTPSFKVKFTEDTSTTRDTLANSFHKVFEGYVELVKTDGPILTEILKSGKIKFSGIDLQNKATKSIPAAFFEKMKSVAAPDPSNIETHLKAVLESPKYSYLFGLGASNSATVEGFKEELYNAFKNRLTEAVAAERKADYDYWWLTLYPKAIPLGDNTLEGQSIIEVNFPERVVPETQYRRWLQDSPDTRYAEEKKPCPGDCVTHVNPYTNKTQIATSVLNDFRSVLDSSDLIDKYDTIREVLIESLFQFTELRPNVKKAVKENKITREKALYQEGIKYLLGKAIDHQNSKLEDERESLNSDSEEANKVPENVNACTETRPVCDFLRQVNARINSNFWDFKKILEDTDDYRNAFAWQEFDIRNVFFAAFVAAEKHIVLPQKIELLTNAYFNGARRYTTEPTSKEKTLEKQFIKDEDLRKFLDTKKYVVPYKDRNIFNEVARHLFLKGIKPGDVSIIVIRSLSFLHQKENMSDLFTKFQTFCTSSGNDVNLCNGSEMEAYRINHQSIINKCSILDAEEPSLVKTIKELDQEDINDKIVYCISKSEEKYKDSFDIKKAFERLAEQPGFVKQALIKYLFKDIQYSGGIQRKKYLRLPVLWPSEMELDQARAALSSLIVNKFHTSYPGVPDPDAIKREFLSKTEHKKTIVYLWLRDLWVDLENSRDRNSQEQIAVKAQLFLDRTSFLTKDAVRDIKRIITAPVNNYNIFEWIKEITGKQFIVDQLTSNLLDHVYGPFFKTLDQLTKVERHSTPLDQVKKQKFINFTHWGKPKIQKGIQVIDMLPASRDDLVSMSVNEGGAIANIAAKAEGAAAYDLNQLQMVMRNAELLRQALSQDASSNTQGESEGIGTLAETLSQTLTNSRQQEFSDLSELNQGANLGAYSLGASAGGSLYSRARSAFAYSKRREYLDAAITAAGRGDNFAKWVVRKSDIRTPVLQQLGDRGDLLAARHNGYPNGDQPFHLLVKIPHNSVQKDWDGTPYVLFNSSYVATKRLKSWDRYGNLAPILKLPLWIINPSWWSKVEESVVGTTYPFKWDVDTHEKQTEMLRERNFLGGRIKLDDTDKINFSEILGRIEAEKNFTKYTREAQSQDILRTMNELSQEAPNFRQTTGQNLQQQLNNTQTLQQQQRTNANIDSRQQGLQTQIEQIRQILTPPPPADPAPAPADSSSAAPAADSNSSAAQPAVPATAATPSVSVPQAETAVIVQSVR